MNRKWYLSTWFISVMFLFSNLILPFIVGVVLLIQSIKENIKIRKQWEESGFGDLLKTIEIKETFENEIKSKEKVLAEITKKKEALEQEITKKKELWELEFANLNLTILQKSNKIKELDDELFYQSFGIYTPKYNFESVDKYKKSLDSLREKQKQMIKSKTATSHFDDWLVEGSKKAGKKMNDENIKITMNAFNTDCDTALSKVTYHNIETMRERINNSFERINKLNINNKICIKKPYLKLKIQELYLAFEYEVVREQQREEQKEEQRMINEKMKEAEKVRLEIEVLKQANEKEEKHFKQEIVRLQEKYEFAEFEEKERLFQKIRELEMKLELVEKDKENLLYREQNTRAGYVYIISNIGSFGEHIYKIGVTRRLEPFERIKELGRASVPFNFDVHAMIFSDDAPALESTLHKTFSPKRVNKINTRKEFFNVSLEEIEYVVKAHHNKIVEFTKIATAQQYRDTLIIKLSNETVRED